jgi:hypothetical protein
MFSTSVNRRSNFCIVITLLSTYEMQWKKCIPAKAQLTKSKLYIIARSTYIDHFVVTYNSKGMREYSITIPIIKNEFTLCIIIGKLKFVVS